MEKLVVRENKELYLYNTDSFDLTFNVSENVRLVVYQYVVNASGKICVNLQCEGAQVEYHCSIINYNSNKLDIIVNHNVSKTVSNVYNHGININKESLVFDVTGKVEKSSELCVVNQENQIINIKDGKSSILPNLLIDNYNVSSSHAAYIGKFKEDKIYYLMSRGISRKKSIELLTRSLLLNQGNLENDKVKEFLKDIEKI